MRPTPDPGNDLSFVLREERSGSSRDGSQAIGADPGSPPPKEAALGGWSSAGDAVLRRITVGAGVAMGSLALLALVGWMTGVLVLARVRADWIPMAPNTAVAFLVIAATLCSAGAGPRLLRIVGISTMLIAVHALAIGQGSTQGHLGPFPLGVMSPVTASMFLAAGLGLVALSSPRHRRLAVPLGVVITGLGLLVALGYAYGAPLLYQGSVIPLALTTGLAFFALGTGLLAHLGPKTWPLRMLFEDSVRARMRLVFIPTVVILTLVQGWLAILIVSGPLEHPAVFAALLAAASVPVTGFAVSGLSRRIGQVIERAERRRIEAEENRARLEERERAAAALGRQKEDLTRLVVHDLKSPLQTIVLGTDLLLMKAKGDARATRILGDVLAAATAMDKMTLDLLDISRSADGALVPALEEIDVPALLQHVVASLGLRMEEAGVEVEVRSNLASPTVCADPRLLQRVLENLLDNCLKYAPKGRAIRLASWDAPERTVRVTVCDEGPGIPPEARERIFEKYSRLEGERARTVRKSHGLGLAFCRLAIEAHGGRIWVEPNQPVGSRFCIELPVGSVSRHPVEATTV